MVKAILTSICFILSINLHANIYPVSLTERIDSSLHVMLAKAIDKQSYWDLDSTSIYTSYRMEVICYTKNPSSSYYFDLILPGGTVEEDVQINYPFLQIMIGQEYLMAVEDVTLYQLNRTHKARSSAPKFQPYTFVQGLLPMHNGFYSDYFEDTLVTEENLLTYIENITQEQAVTPDGIAFESRDSFPVGNGDLDGDGVMDIYDENPSDANSDSDGDGISDYLEQNPEPITNENGTTRPGIISDPLNACDPVPSGGCIGLDFDSDGRYGNYAPTHADYDENDADPCIPYGKESGCALIDNDGDGYASNLPPNNPNLDPNDNNPCTPNNNIQLLVKKDTYTNQFLPDAINGNALDLHLSEVVGVITRPVIQFKQIPFTVPDSAYSQGVLYFHVKNFIAPTEILVNLIPFEWDDSTLSWSNTEIYTDDLFKFPITQAGWNALSVPDSVFNDYFNDPNSAISLNFRTSESPLTISSSESDFPPQFIIELDATQCNTLSAPSTSNRLNANSITLKNGDGIVTDKFVGGTIATDHEMIIEGSGFGATPGLLEFPNADDGGHSKILVEGSDLLYWTDTKIHIKVPKRAGSGDLEIKATNGDLLGAKNVTIEWALVPLYHEFKSFDKPTRQRIHFVDANEEGGYTFHLNTTTGFKANTAAVAAFKKALNTWQCASQINWTIDPSGTTLEKVNDGICVVQFSTTLPTGLLGLTTSRYKASGGSSCNQYNTLWRLKEVDIEFADPSILPAGFNWHYGEGDPAATSFDFESIALHELGHAHGLGHVANEDSPMYYINANGESRRTLDDSDLAAASHKMSYSMEGKCVSSHHPMIAHTDCATATPSSSFNYAEIQVLLEGFYDPTADKMTTQLQEDNLLPLTNPYTNTPFNYTGTEAVDALSTDIADWVLLELRDTADMDHIVHQQVVLLRNDGHLVTVEDSTKISFEGIENGSYYITIHHKSHLPIISSESHPIGPTALLYDFTKSPRTAMGEAQLKEINGKYFMISGDFDNNGAINNLDYNLWKTNSSKLNMYAPADVDGNGIINSLDYNLLKINLSKIGMLQR